MRDKIQLAASILGPTLVVVALAGASIYEANAETVPATTVHPADELTGPQAGCFANVAESIWAAVTPAGVIEFVLWRNRRVEEGVPRIARAFVLERVTTDDAVFAALELADDNPVEERPNCQIEHDAGAEETTYCIRRGSVILTPEQIQAAKVCALAVVPSLVRIEKLTLLAGPPRTIEITRGSNLTPSEYAACRAAKTCTRGEAE